MIKTVYCWWTRLGVTFSDRKMATVLGPVFGRNFRDHDLVTKTCPLFGQGLACFKIVVCQSSWLIFGCAGARRRSPRLDSISVSVSVSVLLSVSVSASASVSVFVVVSVLVFVFSFYIFL